jgi:hypothetical protein
MVRAVSLVGCPGRFGVIDTYQITQLGQEKRVISSLLSALLPLPTSYKRPCIVSCSWLICHPSKLLGNDGRSRGWTNP